MNQLKKWMTAANATEKQALADGAGSTVGSLRQAAGNYKGHNMKAGLARRVEQAAERLRKKNPALPALRRTDLCADCAACEFAKPIKSKK